MVENINTGVCQRRVQEDKPSFFINWKYKGKNYYAYAKIRSDLERYHNYLTSGNSYELEYMLDNFK